MQAYVDLVHCFVYVCFILFAVTLCYVLALCMYLLILMDDLDIVYFRDSVDVRRYLVASGYGPLLVGCWGGILWWICV